MKFPSLVTKHDVSVNVDPTRVDGVIFRNCTFSKGTKIIITSNHPAGHRPKEQIFKGFTAPEEHRYILDSESVPKEA